MSDEDTRLWHCTDNLEVNALQRRVFLLRPYMGCEVLSNNSPFSGMVAGKCYRISIEEVEPTPTRTTCKTCGHWSLWHPCFGPCAVPACQCDHYERPVPAVESTR